MSIYFNTYRIPSARFPNWDYSANGAYFITICTGGREHYFGKIKDGTVYLSDIGSLASKFLLEIPSHFSFVEIDACVVMPNHIHVIIVMNNLFPVETLHATSSPSLNTTSNDGYHKKRAHVGHIAKSRLNIYHYPFL